MKTMTEKLYGLDDARDKTFGTVQYRAGKYIAQYSAVALWLLGVWKLLEIVGVL